MNDQPSRDHYSYSKYADPATARTFDEQRFGGAVGELLAERQAEVLTSFGGDLRNQRVVDVGTGTGRVARVFAAAGAHVTGVDASEAMLAVAARRAADRHDGLSITFLRGDAHALDFPDRSFDVAVSVRVLMHTPQWRVALAELCRVADRLVIIDFPSARSAALLQSAARRAARACGAQTEAYRVFTDSQIARALAQSGFRVRAAHRQFALPIALHKAIGSARFTIAVERLLRRTGIVRLVGSPVTLVAERCASS